jgi:predicted secreted protein
MWMPVDYRFPARYASKSAVDWPWSNSLVSVGTMQMNMGERDRAPQKDCIVPARSLRSKFPLSNPPDIPSIRAMRKALVAGLVVVALILVAFAAMMLRVRPAPKPERPVPQVAFSEDDFREPSAHKTNDITLMLGRKLTVNLGSNPSTGWAWEMDTPNSDPTVLKQVRQEYISDTPPKEHPGGMPGLGGSQSWTFETLKAGTATLQFTHAHTSPDVLEGRRSLKLTVNVQ